MLNKKRDAITLIFLVILFLVINYSFLDKKAESFLKGYKTEDVFVDRVIDGDTIVTGNRSIRLLGINTPERGELYYNEAKSFLERRVLGKNVTLEFAGDRKDKYGRTLAYVFESDENINVEIVRNGFANYYFYSGRDKYSDDLLEVWKSCMNNKVNLCKPSRDICANCIAIRDNEIVNSCSFSCDVSGWWIKGEGREKFIFKETLSPNAKTGFSLDLENSGGGLFLRDDSGDLVLWESY
ncbi:thermonuclease family protein [Candidatus Pacearchaeota archaeon]|nr:thermonuclease family protein [Candidatus Pacearchaeota archaeon]